MKESSPSFPEQRENLAEKFEFSMHLSPHTSALDAATFSGHLANADVFIPEMPTCPPEYIPRLNRLAAGRLQEIGYLKKVMPGDFAHAALDAIGKPRKQRKNLEVEVLDVPYTPEWRQKLMVIKALDNLYISPTLEDALKGISQQAKQSFTLQDERERCIANNVESFLLSRGRKIRANKRPLNVLMVMGYLHTGLVDKLRDREIPVHITPNSHSIDYESHKDKVWRTHQRGEEPSRELLMRTFLSGMINDEGIHHDNTGLRIKFIKDVIDGIPLEQLDKICESVHESAIRNGWNKSGEDLMIQLFGKNKLNAKDIDGLLKQ